MVNKNNIFLLVFAAILIGYLLAEYFNYESQRDFKNSVRQFMQGSGDRFTSEDGYRLCERIRHLEEQHHNTPGYCEPPQEEEDDKQPD